MHEVFTLSTPCSLSRHKCGLKCSLTLLYRVSGICALDFVACEREKPETWQSLCRCPWCWNEEPWLGRGEMFRMYGVCLCIFIRIHSQQYWDLIYNNNTKRDLTINLCYLRHLSCSFPFPTFSSLLCCCLWPLQTRPVAVFCFPDICITCFCPRIPNSRDLLSFWF